MTCKLPRKCSIGDVIHSDVRPSLAGPAVHVIMHTENIVNTELSQLSKFNLMLTAVATAWGVAISGPSPPFKAV